MPKARILSFKSECDDKAGLMASPSIIRAAPVTLDRSVAVSMCLSKGIIGNMLMSCFGPILQDQFHSRCVIADNQYLPVPIPWLMGIINNDPILAPIRYRNEVFDCDDYVLYLKTQVSLYAAQSALSFPLAVGFVLTCRHAFTLCIAQMPIGTAVAIINTQSKDRSFTTDATDFPAFLGIGGTNFVQSVYI